MLLVMLLACGEDVEAPPEATVPTKPPLDTGVIRQAEEEEAPAEANRRPKFKRLELRPLKPTVESTIDARVVAKDPDGDLIDIDLFWTVNGTELPDFAGRQLTSTHFKKGDIVSVRAEVSDGKSRHSKDSAPVVVVNAKPTIDVPRRVSSIDGLQLEASDPDGDAIAWRVEEAPPGFTISDSGRVSYKGSMDVTETTTYTTRIIAEDTSGDYAVWEMGLTVEAAVQPTRSYQAPGG